MEQHSSGCQQTHRRPAPAAPSWLSLAIPISAGMLIVFLFIFAFMNAFNFNIDDVLHIYRTHDITQIHAENRRFVSDFLFRIMTISNTTYYDIIGLWALFFVASIAYLSFELGNYLRLGLFGTLWIAAAAGVHSFTGELYSFTSAYINFGGAIFGAALTVAGLRLLRGHVIAAHLVGVSGALICLGSYQPYIMIPIAAVLLRCIRDDLHDEFRRIPLVELGYLAAILAAGAASIALFSMAYPPSSGARSPSLSAALANWHKLPAMLAGMFRPSKTGIGLLFARHEQAVYLLALLAMFAYPLAKIRKNLAHGAFILAAATGLLLVVAGPLNIFFSPFWPTARSISYDAFVLPALVACIVAAGLERFATRRAYTVVAACAAAFILLSMANQFSLFFARYLQRNADVALAGAIVADLTEKARQGHSDLMETPVAVVGTWRNFAQQPTVYLDYGVSAFTASWSQLPMLRAVSGLPLRGFTADPAQCPSKIDRYEILRVEQGWLVCLR